MRLKPHFNRHEATCGKSLGEDACKDDESNKQHTSPEEESLPEVKDESDDTRSNVVSNLVTGGCSTAFSNAVSNAVCWLRVNPIIHGKSHEK